MTDNNRSNTGVFERQVEERLQQYMKSNVSHDRALELIGRDFPFLSNRMTEICELSAFTHYYITADKSGIAAGVKKLAFMHSSELNMPFQAHLCRKFHIKDDEDVYVSLMVENPCYLSEDALCMFSIYVDDVKVNEFRHLMSQDERRNIYNVPLNILKSGVLGDSGRKTLGIKIIDENVAGRSYSVSIEVFYGEYDADDIFDLYVQCIHQQDEMEMRDSYSLDSLESMSLHLAMSVNDEHGRITDMDGIMIIKPSESENNEEGLIRHISLEENYEEDNEMEGCQILFKCGDGDADTSIPTFNPRSGSYDFEFYIWNQLLWSKTIEFKEGECQEVVEEESDDEKDYEMFIDGFINDLGLEVNGPVITEFTMRDIYGNLISQGEGSSRVRYFNADPTEYTVGLAFDQAYNPVNDIDVFIENPEWNVRLHRTIKLDEYASSASKSFVLKFENLGKSLNANNINRLKIKVLPKGSNIFVIKEEEYIAISFKSYKEYLNVEGFSLYNVDTRDPYFSSWYSVHDLLPQTSFDAEVLDTLVAVCRFDDLKNVDFLKYDTSMLWTLYDQTGRVVDSRLSDQSIIYDHYAICSGFGAFCNYKWSKGAYRIELNWFGQTILSALVQIGEVDVYSDYDPAVIQKVAEVVEAQTDGSAMERLDRMVGLEAVKDKVHSLVNYANLRKMRSEAGLPVKQPSLHACFLGNPGTGKTTVARLLGQIYKEIGLLSSGHVVAVERKNFVGKFYDSEAQAVENAINRAKGGILLIDEAYNLYVKEDGKDPGRRVIEYLLTALSDEDNRDWMLIFAGYPEETTDMIESNSGLSSRVREIFRFEDFDEDTLMGIAELYCDDNRYELSDGAKEKLRSVIRRDMVAEDKKFGNGRYVHALLESAINTKMATRLSKINSPSIEQLVTIEAEDIPASSEDAERISAEGFDEKAIDEALVRLDSLVGLNKVKGAIHNFVNTSRYLNSRGERFTGKGILKWSFTGNTGTGKSTVAGILADILKAMNLIKYNTVTEIKGEEIFNVSDYECNEVLKRAVKKSRRGVLLIDGDAPEFRSSAYRLTSEQVRFKLANLVSEDKATGAIVISECSGKQFSLAHSLAGNGIYDYDHTFIFDDYTENELYQILVKCMNKYGVSFSDEAEAILREYIRNLCTNRDLSFANARTMKNLSRAIYEMMLLRLSSSHAESGDEDRIVLSCDVDSFVWKKTYNRIGF